MWNPGRPDGKDVLVVTDVQYDFLPGGALAVDDGDAVIPVINALGRVFEHAVLTQDWHPPGHLSFASSHPGRRPGEVIEVDYGSQILWPDHCVRQSRGARLHEELDLPCCELILRKGTDARIDSYSAFFENDGTTATGLGGYLRERGLKRLFLTGLATDFCVACTALDARRLGFEVLVVEDACRGIDLDGSLEAALERMLEAGVTIVRAADVAVQS